MALKHANSDPALSFLKKTMRLNVGFLLFRGAAKAAGWGEGLFFEFE
jgi:hypothetical protein